MFITIVGAERYLGIESLRVGQLLVLKKEPDNLYDDEAIRVETESGVKCGYVANSVDSVARGTHSAGYVYNSLNESQKCKVDFVINEKVVAKFV